MNQNDNAAPLERRVRRYLVQWEYPSGHTSDGEWELATSTNEAIEKVKQRGFFKDHVKAIAHEA